MTLTYKHDLDILKPGHHSKTDTHTHRLLNHANDVKTITPIMSETWDVKILSYLGLMEGDT